MDVRGALRRSPLRRPYAALKYRLRSDAREERFTGFYRDNVWGDPESDSGAGSSLKETAHLRRELPGLLQHLEVTPLLDVPCGDFTWMRDVDLSGIDYTVGDIFGSMVADLQRLHGGERRRFLRLDVVSDDLPRADAVLVRDLFLHLPFRPGRARGAQRAPVRRDVAAHEPLLGGAGAPGRRDGRPPVPEPDAAAAELARAGDGDRRAAVGD